MQTARFVVKGALALATGQMKPQQAPASLLYLIAGSSTEQIKVGQTGWLKQTFAKQGRGLVEAALEELQQHPASHGQPQFSGPAWNGCTLSLIAAARAFCHCYMLAQFDGALENAVKDGKLGQAEAAALRRCGQLRGVSVVVEHLGECLLTGALSQAQVCCFAKTLRI